MRARMAGFQDWVHLVNEGPPDNVKRGPILTNVPFPEVLVAKAYSQDGVGMDLVLYPGKDAAEFEICFERLHPGTLYELAGSAVVAGSDGTAKFRVRVDGRTPLSLNARLHN